MSLCSISRRDFYNDSDALVKIGHDERIALLHTLRLAAH